VIIIPPTADLEPVIGPGSSALGDRPLTDQVAEPLEPGLAVVNGRSPEIVMLTDVERPQTAQSLQF